ncbi:2613_t:CDS:10 [Paraglomus occultum]|uniref:2613_t:CDS:1 n=1 Tax=Paraglomus occultum TaxID=144539 RepID=A0A9N8VY47_9GLOM|nr:2613_t:CDS:10 [Paraglomus occultum]
MSNSMNELIREIESGERFSTSSGDERRASITNGSRNGAEQGSTPLSSTIISAINNLTIDENSDDGLTDDEMTSFSEANSFRRPSQSMSSSSGNPLAISPEAVVAPAENLRTIVVDRSTGQIENYRLLKSRESMTDEEVMDFIMNLQESIAKISKAMAISNVTVSASMPVPQGKKVLCKITRKTDGIGKFYPLYQLYVEDPVDDTRTFMLSARKRKNSKSSHYVIASTRTIDNSPSQSVVGKVRSNFLGTAFAIYTNGRNPLKREPELAHLPIREELGAVVYDPNILGFKGPRKMTVLMTSMTKNGTRPDFRPEREEDTLIGKYRNGNDRDILVLHNKSPQWNEETESYVLNFNGRVTLASVKNFQIVHDNDLDYIIMQFGRVSDDTFTMDFMYPICPLQAFAIALTSFDGKLACE